MYKNFVKSNMSTPVNATSTTTKITSATMATRPYDEFNADNEESSTSTLGFDINRIESCYLQEKQTISRKHNNSSNNNNKNSKNKSNNNREQSFDFIIAAKVCDRRKKRAVQDKFLKALQGVLIVSEKMTSKV